MTSDHNNVFEKVSSLERQTWEALKHSGKDFLPYLSRDCIMLFPLGMKVSNSTDPDITTVMTSEAFVPWTSYEMREVAVTPIGEDGAVISYEAEATRPGMEESFRAMISSTWRKDLSSGKWLMCLHQQTPFTPIDL